MKLSFKTPQIGDKAEALKRMLRQQKILAAAESSSACAKRSVRQTNG